MAWQELVKNIRSVSLCSVYTIYWEDGGQSTVSRSGKCFSRRGNDYEEMDKNSDHAIACRRAIAERKRLGLLPKSRRVTK